jgi:hypothetical protein
MRGMQVRPGCGGTLRLLVLVWGLLFMGRFASADEMHIDVQVVPRLGAFNHLVYKIARSGQLERESQLDQGDAMLLDPRKWHPRTWSDYLSGIESGLKKELVPPVPARAQIEALREQWDIITTSFVDPGYSHRRVLVRVLDAPRGSLCTFTVAGQAGTPAVPCEPGQWFRLATNLAAPVTAMVRAPGVDPVAPLYAEVPEDFLIVALGDSFLSGQGNPDGREKRPISWNECASLPDPLNTECFKSGRHNARAWWMDDRCQRSAWSTPIQAGLTVIRQMPEKFGAVTVVSFACSGAKVGAGLVEEYEGQLTFDDFRRRTPADQWSARANDRLARSKNLPPQTQAVVKLLADQGPQRKTTIDLLLLDGGGNDIGFANIVADLVLAKSKFESLDAYATLMGQRLETLKSSSYPHLQQGLNGFQVAHAIAMAYPDPTRIDDDTGCGGEPVDSLGLRILSGFAGDVSSLIRGGAPLDFKISPEEARFAGRKVLDPLNTTVTAFADAAQFRYFGDAMPLLRGRGWCAQGQPNDPYEESPRWVRSLEESFHTQGDFNGAMHPTWQYHQAAAKLLASFAVDAAHTDTKVDFVAEEAPAEPGQSTKWTSPKLRVAVAGPSTYSVCDELGACRIAPGEFTYAHLASVPSVFKIEDTKTRYRTWSQRHGGPYKVDAMAPDVTCSVFEGASMRGRCENVPVLSATSQLRLDAQDAESGLAVVSLMSGAGALAQSTASFVTTASHLSLPNGKIDIAGQAVDRVGNVRTASYSFVLDTTPPRLQSVNGFMYEGAANAVPLFFVHRVSTTTLTFVVTDNVTGPCDLQLGIHTDPFAVATRLLESGDCATGAAAASNTGGSRTFSVAFRPAGSANQNLEAVEFVALPRDYAGNLAVPQSSPVHHMLILPYAGCSSSCALSPQVWAKGKRAAEAQRIKDAAAGLGVPVPTAKPTQAEQAAVDASWLNFLSGRLGGTRTAGGKLYSVDCELVDGEGEAYESLSNMTACIGRGHNVAAAAAAMRFIPR